MRISDYAVDHPVPVTIIVAVIAVFGVMAASTLTQAMFPDFAQPTINVSVTYPGVSPEEMERQVTNALEDELSRLSDIKSIKSRSLPSRSSVSLEFYSGTDIDTKLIDVREQLNVASAKLPEGISGVPVIRKMDPSEMPVLTVGLDGGTDTLANARYADETVLPLLTTVPGVASVDLIGRPERALEVRLDPDRLSSLGVSPVEVAQAMSASASVVPSGSIDYGQRSVAITSESSFATPEQARSVVVAARGGAPIRVGDVASVAVSETETGRRVLVNGSGALLVDVMAQQGADTVEIIKEIKRRLADLESTDGFMGFSYYRDQSIQIVNAIESVVGSALMGGSLAVVVLFLFLGSVGPTVIIALSIPFTIIISFVALYVNGHTLNVMTLGGLTVAIGMIVDASIVMLEHIWTHMANGEDAISASKKGAAEMGGAIIASTMTSIVVFAPLVFVQGITGIVLKDTAYTIIYALSGSVLASVLIVPFLSARILRPHRLSDKGPSAAVRRALASVESWYASVLDKALDHARFIIAIGVAVLLLSISLLELVGFEFIPELDSRELIIELDVPAEFNVERGLGAAMEAERLISEIVPEAERRVFFVGQSGAWSASPTIESHTYGFITLADEGRSVFDIIPVVREKLASALPDVKVNVRNGGSSDKTASAMGGAGFRVIVSASAIEDAAEAAETIAAFLREDAEVRSAELSITTDVRSLTNRIDLDAAGSLGVAPSDATQTGRILFNGVEVGEFDDDGEDIPVIVLADVGKSLRDDLFYSIPVKSRTGKPVSLAAISTLESSTGMSEIPREQRAASVTVVAQLDSSDFRGVEARLRARMSAVALPFGVSWKTGGSAAETISSFRSLLAALAVGIFLVYAVMAIQFERYRQPFIVLSAIPFVLIGVILALLAFGSSLSIIAILGVISLAGVAVNNAIIMIDYTNLLRSRDGLDLRDAIVRGASSRVRPILMTTLTTLLGVVPLAFASGGGETMAVLGQVILGGLATSTIITFFLTPSLYWLSERKRERKALEKKLLITEAR